MTHSSPFPGADEGVCGLSAGEYGALIASRICHDLISPVGAVNNGVELLAELGGAAGEAEIALIETSAAMASAGLEFQRIAFGAAGPEDRLGLTAVHRIAGRWFAHQKPQLDWPAPSGEMSRAAGRLLLNLLQVGASSLPRGGSVRVRLSEEAEGVRMEVAAEGMNAAPPAGAADWLVGRAAAAPPAPRDAHHLAASVHARAAGATIKLSAAPGVVSVAARAR